MAILSSDHVKMTSILEKAISVIAPHRCIVCGNYDNVVCTACMYSMQRLEVPLCVVCGVSNASGAVCGHHQEWLARCFVAYEYGGAVKQALHAYKFEHARAAYKPLAAAIASSLPYLDESWCIVAIPTISPHVRQRGYDHAALLGQEVARLCGVPYRRLLRRVYDTRQVGATRDQRINQMHGAFTVRGGANGCNVLLIDDVCTTGATLVAAAHALHMAGAAEVSAAVVAYRP